MKKQQQQKNDRDELAEDSENCPCTLFKKEDIFLLCDFESKESENGSVSIFTSDINGNLANGSEIDESFSSRPDSVSTCKRSLTQQVNVNGMDVINEESPVALYHI